MSPNRCNPGGQIVRQHNVNRCPAVCIGRKVRQPEGGILKVLADGRAAGLFYRTAQVPYGKRVGGGYPGSASGIKIAVYGGSVVRPDIVNGLIHKPHGKVSLNRSSCRVRDVKVEACNIPGAVFFSVVCGFDMHLFSFDRHIQGNLLVKEPVSVMLDNGKVYIGCIFFQDRDFENPGSRCHGNHPVCHDILPLHGKQDRSRLYRGVDKQSGRITGPVVLPVEPYFKARVIVIEISLKGVIEPEGRVPDGSDTAGVHGRDNDPRMAGF